MLNHRLRLARLTGEGGQGLVEYALILILVSLVVIIMLISLGSQVNDQFHNIVNAPW